MSLPVQYTAPPAQQTGSLRFAAFGDYGFNGQGERSVAALIATLDVDFIITTGDNSYGSASIDTNVGQHYHDYIGIYTGGFPPGAEINRFFPTLGNHDLSDGGGLAAYLNYFTLPGEGIPSSNTSGNERYYDFIQGPVHFFALNSNLDELDGITPDSPQGQWLQTQLAASTAPWKIVYFHHPPYSSGYHGNSAWMQWPFAAWGVTAVLSGHDHDYERLIVDDFPYFVTGAGGNSTYWFTDAVPGSITRYALDYGTLLVVADETSLQFEFWSIADGGTLIDSYTIINDLPTATPTATPTVTPLPTHTPTATATPSPTSAATPTIAIIISSPTPVPVQSGTATPLPTSGPPDWLLGVLGLVGLLLGAAVLVVLAILLRPRR